MSATFAGTLLSLWTVMNARPAKPKSACHRQDSDDTSSSVQPIQYGSRIEETAPNQAAADGIDCWRVINGLTLMMCAPTLLALGARWSWFLDLFTHFRVYYAVGLLMCAGVFLAGRKWRWVVVSLAVSGFNAGSVLPLYVGVDAAESAGRTYRGLLANVYTGNRQHDRFRQIDFCRTG